MLLTNVLTAGHSPLGSAWVVQLLTLDSIAAFQKSTFEDNALVKEFRCGEFSSAHGCF